MKIREWFEGTKVQNHPAWLRRLIKDPFSVPPIYCEVSPAGGCNHRCLHCAPSILEFKYNYLSLPVLTRFFGEARELREADPDGLGIRSVQFAGEGEPMLEPQLGKICEQARIAGIDVGMLSNGVAFTEKRAEEVLPFINVYLQFSVNAGTAESYANFHQVDPGDWSRLWDNIRRVARIKRELKSKCEVGVNMTVTVKGALNKKGARVKANWPEAEALIQRTRDAGADYVCFKPYRQPPQNRETFELYGDMSYEPIMDEILETGERLRERYETDDFEVVFRFSRFKEYEMPDRGYPVCHATPTLWCYMQSDGLLVSCSGHWLPASKMAQWRESQFYLGNIKEQGFREIWFGERREQHLESMKTFDISVCTKSCHPDHENRYLYWLLNLQPEEQEAELRRLEANLAAKGFPHRGNII
ncbi:MAG: radical SAM protein [Patescibacteria group bacterium]